MLFSFGLDWESIEVCKSNFNEYIERKKEIELLSYNFLSDLEKTELLSLQTKKLQSTFIKNYTTDSFLQNLAYAYISYGINGCMDRIDAKILDIHPSTLNDYKRRGLEALQYFTDKISWYINIST